MTGMFGRGKAQRLGDVRNPKAKILEIQSAQAAL